MKLMKYKEFLNENISDEQLQLKYEEYLEQNKKQKEEEISFQKWLDTVYFYHQD